MHNTLYRAVPVGVASSESTGPPLNFKPFNISRVAGAGILTILWDVSTLPPPTDIGSPIISSSSPSSKYNP